MNLTTRSLGMVALALNLTSIGHAAVVVDELHEPLFRGCYYLTCPPGTDHPVGVMISRTSSLDLSASSEIRDAVGIGFHVVDGLAVTSVRRDDESKAFLGAELTGSFAFTAGLDRPFSSGGTVTVSNLKVDIASKSVIADMAGRPDADASGAFALSGVALWSFSQVTGPAAFDPTLYTRGQDVTSLARYALSGLVLTQDAQGLISRGLGLTGLSQASLAAADLGVLTVDLRYGPLAYPTASVPEPSSWALMGVGLLGLALARRRAR